MLPALPFVFAAAVAHGQSANGNAVEGTEPAHKLDTVNVSDRRYTPVPLDLPKGRFVFGLTPMPVPTVEPTLLGPFVVTATRGAQAASRVSVSARVIETAALQSTPAATLDSVLRSYPGFSLFRRSDSLTSHPTAQGVSLRGIGPSGASRTLVLLDGIPLNDPFGGWVNWARIPRDAIARVEIVSGGAAAAWGTSALGGAVQVFSAQPRAPLVIIDRPPAPIAWGSRGTLTFTALAGDFQTRSADVVLTRPVGGGILQLVAEDFRTDGFPIVAAERRGPVDVAAWSRHLSLAAKWRRAVTKTVELTATVRRFEEFRGNGTPYQRNGARDSFASVQLFGQPTDASYWKLVAYAQQQSFASTFSSVNSTRTAETPASDQFAVPATTFGASWTGTWNHGDGSTTTVGGDTRGVRGETRENFSFQNGGFTRQRVAGGAQAFAGWFASHQRRIADSLRANAGLRLDAWQDTDGHRRELDRATGVVSRDEIYAERRGTEFSPTAGIVWTPTRQWRLRANGQQAFRRPTLNELYRPFRQGVNIVEANAELRTERITSAELGAEWTLLRAVAAPAAPAAPAGRRAAATSTPTPRTQAKPLVVLGATVFSNELRDAVSNVTLARGPGVFPLFGSLPAGGVGRQRLNLDRTRVAGAELSAMWQPNDAIRVETNYLYDDATVRRAAVAPQLVGRRLAEVPRHSVSLALKWNAPGKLVVSPRVRWIGRQFDDDENTLRLGEAVIADFGVSRALGKHLELFLNVENLANARVETARTADGIVNIGTPRFAFGGIRGSW